MSGWAITFLIVALVAAVLGFGGIATFAVDLAKIGFFVALVLFVISAVVALIRGRSRQSASVSKHNRPATPGDCVLAYKFQLRPIVAGKHSSCGEIGTEVIRGVD